MTAANMGTLEGTGGGVTLFGFTLTGKALGILIGLLGVGAAGYATFTITLPDQERATALESQIEQLKTDISSQQAVANTISQKEAELAEVKKKSDFVLSLLPTVDNIDTLVSDLNAQIPPSTTITLSNGVSAVIDSRLKNFTPSISADGGLYETYSFNIAFDSTFPAAIEAIQRIEKLQSFLVIKDIKLNRGQISAEELNIPSGFDVDASAVQLIIANLTPKVSVSFKLDAYVPKKNDPNAPPAQ
jgi:type IV pilus assembly protein PilO